MTPRFVASEKVSRSRGRWIQLVTVTDSHTDSIVGVFNTLRAAKEEAERMNQRAAEEVA